MKKVVLFLAVAALTSCGGSVSTESSTSDSTSVIDSTLVADTTVVADTVVAGGGSPVVELTPADGSNSVKKEEVK